MKNKILSLSLFFCITNTSNAAPLDEKRILKNMPETIQANAAKYIKPILAISSQIGLDPELLISLAWTETHFKPRESLAGAKGLMQLMPDTEAYLRETYKKELETLKFYNFIDVVLIGESHFENIALGCLYFKELLGEFDNTKFAILAYNMGPNHVKQKLRKKISIGQNHQYLKKIQKRRRIISQRDKI